MIEIDSFTFNQAGVARIREKKYGVDWPIVYIIENGKEMYVGETIRACGRTKEHLENEARGLLNTIHVISDDEFNKSATLDTESSLIEYLVADGKYKLQNGNAGLKNHDYFDREKYKGKFEVLWEKLREMKIARNTLLQIRNSDIFKYSPYKTLTDDQFTIALELLEKLRKNDKNTFIIHGGPGTGKTILATYLVKQIVETSDKNVALVVAMSSLRNTLKDVFRNSNGLSASMVIGPNDVNKQKYDILIVDEAHRLRQRKNIVNYAAHDRMNKSFGLGNEGTEPDWILKAANNVILFFDEKQSVRPSDIRSEKFTQAATETFHLQSQMRVKGGDEYINFIDHVLEVAPESTPSFSNYDFTIYDDIGEMVADIKEQDKKYGLCRVIAGYAWEWVSRNNKENPDIVIADTKLFWNSIAVDWVNSPNAVNEVGCIHTIQGYDLNYAGVIIGPEIAFDPISNEIVIKKEHYQDSNGHIGITDPEELKRYIVNIYKTLLTRAIVGTYIYVVDENLRAYFKRKLLVS